MSLNFTISDDLDCLFSILKVKRLSRILVLFVRDNIDVVFLEQMYVCLYV